MIKKAHTKIIYVYVTFVIVVGALIGILCLVLNRINVLEKRIDELSINPIQTEQELLGKETFGERKDSISYVAIGNSISKHPMTDYWWSECGMAASTPEKDYYHLLCDHMHKEYDKVDAVAVFFREWELLPDERGTLLFRLDPFLDQKPDIVSIQLSENAWGTGIFDGSPESEVSENEISISDNDMDGIYEKLYSDYLIMIDHIWEKSPDSRIILVDDYWSERKSELKQRLASETKCEFVSLKDLRIDHDKYDAGMGAVVYGYDGKEHRVESEGVAMHPGDIGMKYIADEMWKVIDKGGK